MAPNTSLFVKLEGIYSQTLTNEWGSVNKAEKRERALKERRSWSQNISKVAKSFIIFQLLSSWERERERECGELSEGLKLKDTQACSGVSRRSTDGQTHTSSLSILGLQSCSAWKAFHAHTKHSHIDTPVLVCTLRDSSNIKMQKQLNTNHNSACREPTWQQDFGYFN